MFDDKNQSSSPVDDAQNNKPDFDPGGLNKDKDFPFQKIDEPPKKELAGNKGAVEDILADAEKESVIPKAVEPDKPNESEEEPGLKQVPNVPSMQEPGAKTPMVPPTPKSELASDIQTPPLVSETPTKKPRKIFTIILIVFIVAIVGLVGVFAYRYFMKPSAPPSEVEPGDSLQELLNTLSEEPKEVEEPPEPQEPPTPPPIVKMDTDNDGLTDEEEIELGTNPNKFDTDGDGLSDFEETEIYQTDPVHPDSDRDSYLDGDEVERGFDPLRGGGARL